MASCVPKRSLVVPHCTTTTGFDVYSFSIRSITHKWEPGTRDIIAVKVSMKGGNGPVFITPSRPGDSQDGRLFFYVPVSASVVARSGVLSSIQKAGRNGKLPDCVTSGDFQLWRDAELPQDNSAIIEKLDGKQLATVCTVLKVWWLHIRFATPNRLLCLVLFSTSLFL